MQKRSTKSLGLFSWTLRKLLTPYVISILPWVWCREGLTPTLNILLAKCTRVSLCTSTPKRKRQILLSVKQGDPMSPLLFNLVLGPLLCKLENLGEGNCQGSFKVTAMAFADDLVLLSDRWEGMCTNIKILETICHLTGLKTQGRSVMAFTSSQLKTLLIPSVTVQCGW